MSPPNPRVPTPCTHHTSTSTMNPTTAENVADMAENAANGAANAINTAGSATDTAGSATITAGNTVSTSIRYTLIIHSEAMHLKEEIIGVLEAEGYYLKLIHVAQGGGILYIR